MCAGSDLPADDVLDLLDGAGRQVAAAAVADGPAPRYRMLETIREYGVERLADARRDRRDPAPRTPQHFLALAETAEPLLRGREQLRVDRPAHAERDNLLAALRFAADVGDADTALRLAAALGWYWTARGEHVAAATLLPPPADLPGEARPDARAVCMVVGAVSNAAAGDGLRGADRTAGAAAHELDVDGSWAEHPMLGPAGADRRRCSPATRRTERSSCWSGLPQRRGPVGVGRPGGCSARCCTRTRATSRSTAEYLKQALEGYREIGERWGLAATLAATGSVRLADGDAEGSVAAYAQAHGLMAEITANEDASFTRTRLALAYARAGDEPRPGPSWPRPGPRPSAAGRRIGLVSADLVLAELARRRG